MACTRIQSRPSQTIIHARKENWELRSLTRLRVSLLETQTAFKKRVYKILQICNIRLASKLSNIFGNDGQMLLNALMNGESIDEVIDKYGSKRLKAKKEEVKASILGTLERRTSSS